MESLLVLILLLFLSLPVLLPAIGILLALSANQAAERLVPWIEVPSEGCDPQPLRFDGSTSAYYRIWLPSAFLTLVTLGLYGPWSKTRQNRYLYGHTAFGRRRFSYLGDPWALFLMQLLWLVVLAVLVLAPNESALGGLVASILCWFLVPLLLYLGLRFKVRSTALGGISCSFNGRLGEAWRIHFTTMVGSGLTLGLTSPCFLRRALSYFCHHILWGQRRIRVGVPLRALYLAMGAGMLAALPPLLLGLGLAAASLQWPFLIEWVGQPAMASEMASQMASEMASQRVPSPLAVGLPALCLIVGLFPAYRVGRALALRAVLADFAIEGVGRLTYHLSAGRTAWVAWVHAWACLLSLGLLIPWARVRWLRLQADHLVLLALPPEALREAPPAPQPALPKPALTVEDRSSAPIEFVL